MGNWENLFSRKTFLFRENLPEKTRTSQSPAVTAPLIKGSLLGASLPDTKRPQTHPRGLGKRSASPFPSCSATCAASMRSSREGFRERELYPHLRPPENARRRFRPNLPARRKTQFLAGPKRPLGRAPAKAIAEQAVLTKRLRRSFRSSSCTSCRCRTGRDRFCPPSWWCGACPAGRPPPWPVRGSSPSPRPPDGAPAAR